MASSEGREPDYEAMKTLMREMLGALKLLEDADQSGDHYLRGQARERFWEDYWALREAAADGLASQAQLKDLESRLRVAVEALEIVTARLREYEPRGSGFLTMAEDALASLSDRDEP